MTSYRFPHMIVVSFATLMTVGCSPSVQAGLPEAFEAPPCGSHGGAGIPPVDTPRYSGARGRYTEPTVADMIKPGEGLPHGAVTASNRPFSWALKPRVWRGNTPQSGWQGITATAMIYAAQENPVSRGVRVQVRNLRLFVRPNATNAWCELDYRAAPFGDLFVENFVDDKSIRAPLRPELSGGVSVRLVVGHNFHFWGNIRLIPEGGVSGAYVQYEARVIPDDDGKREDVATAAYIGAASADYWKTPNSPSGHVMTFNEDAAIGRFKRLSGKWRLFTMNTNGGAPQAPPCIEVSAVGYFTEILTWPPLGRRHSLVVQRTFQISSSARCVELYLLATFRGWTSII